MFIINDDFGGKMTPAKIQLWEGVSLSAIKTDKFKTGMISLSLTSPLCGNITASNMLLSGILRRGSEAFPSMALLNRRLDELYASSIEIKNLRHGKTESLILSAEMLDNAFISDGTDILDGVLEVLSQLLLHPLCDGESFPDETLKRNRLTLPTQ